MLIGSFHHTLEQKGRLAIPANFRKSLGEKPILTQGIESYLQLLPFNTWSKLTRDLGEHPFSSPQTRQIRRLLAHTASRVEYDSQGRILISKSLIAFAHLKKKVVIAGSIDWVEIWDIDTHVQHLATLQKTAPSLVDSFSLNKNV